MSEPGEHLLDSDEQLVAPVMVYPPAIVPACFDSRADFDIQLFPVVWSGRGQIRTLGCIGKQASWLKCFRPTRFLKIVS